MSNKLDRLASLLRLIFIALVVVLLGSRLVKPGFSYCPSETCTAVGLGLLFVFLGVYCLAVFGEGIGLLRKSGFLYLIDTASLGQLRKMFGKGRFKYLFWGTLNLFLGIYVLLMKNNLLYAVSVFLVEMGLLMLTRLFQGYGLGYGPFHGLNVRGKTNLIQRIKLLLVVIGIGLIVLIFMLFGGMV